MNNLAASTVACLALTLGYFGYAQAHISRAHKAAAPVWEYKALSMRGDGSPDIEATLNQLGADGWELVTESRIMYTPAKMMAELAAQRKSAKDNNAALQKFTGDSNSTFTPLDPLKEPASEFVFSHSTSYLLFKRVKG